MIILTNNDINTLIKSYLYDEKYYHTYFSFVNEAECADSMQHTLKELLMKGLQFVYLEECGRGGGTRVCEVVMDRDERYFMGKCVGVVRDVGKVSGGEGEEKVKSGGEGEEKVKSGGEGEEKVKSGGEGEEKVKSGGEGEEKVKSGGKGEEKMKSGGGAIKNVKEEKKWCDGTANLKHDMVHNIRLEDCMPLIALKGDEMVIAYGGMVEINKRCCREEHGSAEVGEDGMKENALQQNVDDMSNAEGTGTKDGNEEEGSAKESAPCESGHSTVSNTDEHGTQRGERKNTVMPRTATLSDQYRPMHTHHVNDVITAITSAPTDVYYGTLSGSVFTHARTYRITRAPILSLRVYGDSLVCADSEGVVGECGLDGRGKKVYKVFEGACYEVEVIEGGYVCGSGDGEVVLVSTEAVAGNEDGGDDVSDANHGTNTGHTNHVTGPTADISSPNITLLYKHRLSINHLTSSPTHITCSSSDHTTTLLHISSPSKHVYNDHTASVNAHLHHNRLYTVSTDKQMLVYDNERLVERYVHDGPVYAMGYGEWYGLIGTGTLGKCVYFYDGRIGMVDRVCVGVGVREMVFCGWVVGYCGVEGGVGAVDVRMMYKGGY
ncbi:hypothetical protein VCUG_02259 [Vavraia culicis subsp. floridensis]|uniref:Uncharacterized protein n=1 Tax=Vavraia culicis (isolate floridensis) TaxID=948595 RepID=L2GT19_VAVCU|nr:uncharacterized protein VCUG_02259 [Vavraia culicis subsp. floridensis]ELA46250.1 hypothetical protein VCUG_02259 [Vavraia culicis subsp. floridensis]